MFQIEKLQACLKILVPFVALMNVNLDHIYRVNGEIALEPLWDVSANTTGHCSVQSDEESESVLFSGDRTHPMCGLQISTNSTILMTVSRTPPEGWLYIKRNGVLNTCDFEYRVISGNFTECTTTLFHPDIEIYLQGNADITLTETNTNQRPNCSEREFHLSMNRTSIDCDVRDHSDVITCEDQGSQMCTLIFPPSCVATLLDKSVTFECEGGNYVYHHQAPILVFPSAVRYLKLSENNIGTIDVAALRDFRMLRDIYLNLNQIEQLPVGVFDDLTNLRHLLLRGNLLSTLEVGLFDDLEELLVLDIGENKLQILHSEVFKYLENLEELYLDDNEISYIDNFQGLPELKILDLSRNFLLSLDAEHINSLSSLEFLYLDKNRLQKLGSNCFDNVTNLRLLELGDNLLSKIDFNLFHKLTNVYRLSLHRNVYTRLDVRTFQNMTKLEQLRLMHGHMVRVDVGLFAGLHRVEVLSIYNNSLEVVEPGLFQDLNNTLVLNMGLNRIRFLSPEVFKGMTSLEVLYIEKNELVDIVRGTFFGLRRLHILTLHLNQLKHVDFGVFADVKNLTLLDLSQNLLQSISIVNACEKLNFLNLQENSLMGVTKASFEGLDNGSHMYVSPQEVCECYVPADVNCSAAGVRSPYLTCDRLMSDRVLGVMIWVIGLAAVAGNLFVLCYKSKHSRNRIQCFLLSNLAMSDLLMGFYMIIMAIADIYFGERFPLRAEIWRTGLMCKIAGALSIVSSESSVFFVTLISVNRFINIKYPHSVYKLRRRSTMVITGLLWVFSMVLGIVPPFLAGIDPRFYDNSHVCIGLPLALVESYTTHTSIKEIRPKYRKMDIEISISVPSDDKSGMYFSIAVFLGLNCACYVLIATCYIMIIRTVYKSSHRAGLNQEMKNQIRLTLKVAAIVATDFFCWFPVILLGILVQTGVTTLPPSVFAWVVTFVLPINSAINPYLYTVADIVSYRQRRVTVETLTLPKPSGQLDQIASIGTRSEFGSNGTRRHAQQVLGSIPLTSGTVDLPNAIQQDTTQSSNV